MLQPSVADFHTFKSDCMSTIRPYAPLTNNGPTHTLDFLNGPVPFVGRKSDQPRHGSKQHHHGKSDSPTGARWLGCGQWSMPVVRCQTEVANVGCKPSTIVSGNCGIAHWPSTSANHLQGIPPANEEVLQTNRPQVVIREEGHPK